MKKEHTNFITGLLTNSKLTTHQRDRVVELALRDLSKNGSEERILKDLELIKDNLGIKVELPNEENIGGNKSKNGAWVDIISEGGENEDAWKKFAGNDVDLLLPNPFEKENIPEDLPTVSSTEKLVENTENQKVIPEVKSDGQNSSFGETMTDEELDGLVKNVVDKKKNIKNQKIFYVDKKNTAKFLRSLNANTYTKFLTHEIDTDDLDELKNLFDEDYSFSDHLEKIKEVFDVLTNHRSKHKGNHPQIKQVNISRNLYSKIKNYITGEKLWGESKNEINWSHPELFEWCKNNPTKVPSPGNDVGYKGFIYNETAFNKIVLAFKQEVNIRNSNSFTAMFSTIIFDPKYDFRNKIKFDLDIDDSIEIFTDVEKLKQVIRSILSLIIDKNPLKEKPKVNVKFYAFEDQVFLNIMSIESYIDSNINSFRYGKSIKNLMKLCNGICDIELKALFKNSKVYQGPIWINGFVLESEVLSYFGNKINIFELYKEVNSSNDNKSTFGVEYILTIDLGL